MDNLTHSATGWLLSRAGLNRLSPHITPVLLLAANIPDSDIVLSLLGRLVYFEQHRLWTHTWLLLPVMAALPVLIVWLFARHSLKLLPAYAASLAGVASHILLDWCNSYPTRFAMPFSSRQFHLDLLFILDPWMLSAMALALMAPLLARLVGDEIGARRSTGRGAAVFGLCLMTLWIGFHWVLHDRVASQLESRVYDRESPLRSGAYPTINPFAWDAVVETESAFHKQRVNAMREFDPGAGKVFFKPAVLPALEAAREAEPFRFLQYFAAFPLWRLTPVPQGTRVELIDLRYGEPRNPAFAATAVVNNQGQVLATEFAFGRPRP